MTAAILDVTTIVVARAVDEADLGPARRIAEKAAAIDSGSDRPLLDLALVMARPRAARPNSGRRCAASSPTTARPSRKTSRNTYQVMLRRGWVGLTQAS
jgi:hypothetical protein